jgi:hypothetical protein
MTAGLHRLLCWFAVFVAGWSTVVPTVQALWIRHQVVSAVRSAQSVRLEEFEGVGVLSKVDLDVEQRNAVASALPIVPDVGWPDTVRRCFVPHHRVIARNAYGQEFAFTVCFGCEQVMTLRAGIFATPFLWRSTLRRLFNDHKI